MIKQKTLRLIKNYCHVEDPEGIDALRSELNNDSQLGAYKKSVKDDLQSAIDHPGTITAAEIEKLTGSAVDTQEDAQLWLKWLWSELFTDNPVEYPF